MKRHDIGRAYDTDEGEQECIKDIGGKPEGKRPLGRPRWWWIISKLMLER
jgi:hypothetical protein